MWARLGFALRQVGFAVSRIVSPRRMALRIVGAAVQHLREEVFGVRWPGAERDEPAMRLLARRRFQCRYHPIRCRGRPLASFVREHKHRREPVRPARIGPDAAHPRACISTLNSCLLCGVPCFPRALVGELAAHERNNMLKGNPRLLKRRRHDHGFATRHRERTVQGRTRNC